MTAKLVFDSTRIATNRELWDETPVSGDGLATSRPRAQYGQLWERIAEGKINSDPAVFAEPVNVYFAMRIQNELYRIGHIIPDMRTNEPYTVSYRVVIFTLGKRIMGPVGRINAGERIK